MRRVDFDRIKNIVNEGISFADKCAGAADETFAADEAEDAVLTICDQIAVLIEELQQKVEDLDEEFKNGREFIVDSNGKFETI